MSESDPEAKYSKTELLIAVIARMLDGLGHVAVGASSPIPGAAALLARARAKDIFRVSVLSSQRHNDFTDGARELFDCAAQGRIDAFFLGGGQIDGQANVNLVGLGDYPELDVRFPGTYGSAYLYFLVPRVILFRQEHSRRVMVPKVDFISAPGVSPPGLYRPGGPHALVTERCVFSFDRAAARFCLESVHAGESAESVHDNTGFDFDCPAKVPQTPPPSPEILALIRGVVGADIAEVYPKFARQVLGID
ncbi:MAG: CoA synthetase [Rhodospirillaceae bacterium]|nr:CoA synthetase [Rhodospirillaceae bacterium]MBT3627949.1 CoA synthetase [Rhodospirillaceae bacterium]MBT3927999.1 CoA synthetase [Rhodospirillaceae bacterium]MBT4427507.1 CoA synthetase [Rhodospirillaceae bacterium]MBT5677543.1 CoA synthetase [Rhodospirillaceae bacterium]